AAAGPVRPVRRSDPARRPRCVVRIPDPGRRPDRLPPRPHRLSGRHGDRDRRRAGLPDRFAGRVASRQRRRPDRHRAGGHAVVRRRHAVPNALLPSATLVSLNLAGVLSGSVLVETVFSWPGLGSLFYAALSVPDLPLLQGLFLVFSASVIVMNLIADLSYPL